jgi:hypothetical protein
MTTTSSSAGQREPDVDQPADQRVDHPSAQRRGHTQRRADEHGPHRHHRGRQQATARAGHHAGEHVRAELVGAQPVPPARRPRPEDEVLYVRVAWGEPVTGDGTHDHDQQNQHCDDDEHRDTAQPGRAHVKSSSLGGMCGRDHAGFGHGLAGRFEPPGGARCTVPTLPGFDCDGKCHRANLPRRVRGSSANPSIRKLAR